MELFHATKEESETIREIALRAVKLCPCYKSGTLIPCMDVEATHCNGTPLRLKDLAKASDFDFVHDLQGIYHHLNRETGKLKDGFIPRFAKTS